MVLPFNLIESCRRCDFKPLCRWHPLRLREQGEETSSGSEGMGLKALNKSAGDKEGGDGDGYRAKQSCDHDDG